MGFLNNIKYRLEQNKKLQHERILKRKKQQLEQLKLDAQKAKEISKLDKEIEEARKEVAKNSSQLMRL